MKSQFAFVLGNGITRLEVDCESLLNYGTVYGCNRIYQEFSPSVLVSTDKEIAHEIQRTGYSASHTHYTRDVNLIPKSGAKVLPKDIHGYSSGPAAVGLALHSNQSYIFLIGMDFKGTNNLINNIYADTAFYKSSKSEATHYGNWLTQISHLLEKNPLKRLFHVNPYEGFQSEELCKYDNYTRINLHDFKQMINNS